MASRKKQRVLKLLREVNGKKATSLRALARQAGVAPSTLSRIAKEEGLDHLLPKKATKLPRETAPETAGVTLRSVAQRAGVSVCTASLALRHHPKVSAATKAKVEAAAKALGYQVHPHVGAQMAAIRKGRIPQIKASLAYILGGEGRSWEKAYASDFGPRREFDAAKEKAAQLGYSLEPFYFDAVEMTGERLSRILHARGTKGLILDMPGGWLHFHPFDVRPFSCVSLSELQHTPVHNILHDFYTNIVMLYTELWIQGYRRIGYLSNASVGHSLLYTPEAGYLMAQHQLARLEDQIAPFPSDIITNQLVHYLRHGEYRDPDARTEERAWLRQQDWTSLRRRYKGRPIPKRKLQQEIHARWLKENQFDAIIVQDNRILPELTELGIRVPQDLGVAHLDLNADVSGWSGIRGADEAIGATAVDLLVRSIDHGDLGLPQHPLRVRLPGQWAAGKTTRKIAQPRYPLTSVVQRWANVVLHRPGADKIVPLQPREDYQDNSPPISP